MKFVNNLLKKIPYIRRSIDSLKGPNFESVLKSLFINELVVVDVGANKGQTIETFRKQFKILEIHAFEPTPILFDMLNLKYAKCENIHIHNTAISDKEGEIDFWISEYSPTNSLLKPNMSTYIEQLGTDNKLTSIFRNSLETIKVKTLKFDNWYSKNLNEKCIDVFKSDTQGYDYNVLLGSQNSLPKIKCILVEMQFMNFYEYSVEFYYTIEFLYDNGFFLYNIFKNNNLQIFECDALFLNKNYF